MQHSIHVQPAGALNSTLHYSSWPLYFSQVTECFVISPIDHPLLKFPIIKCFVEILFFFFLTQPQRQSISSGLNRFGHVAQYTSSSVPASFLLPISPAAKSCISVSVYHHKKGKQDNLQDLHFQISLFPSEKHHVRKILNTSSLTL